MPTLNVNGQRVNVDDSFLKMSPEQQNATVDEIAKSLKPKEQKPRSRNTLGDIVQSAPQAILRGITDYARSSPFSPINPIAGDVTAGGRALESQVDRPVEALPQPQTKMGEYASSGIRAVSNPGSYSGGGAKLGLEALAALFGGLGSKAGEDVTQGSKWGSVAGGVLGSILPGGAARTVHRLDAPFPTKSPEHATDVSYLRSKGIEPDAGDVSGRSGMRAAQEMAGNIGGGRSYEAVKEPPLRQLTKAVTEEMGEPVDRIVPDSTTIDAQGQPQSVPGTISKTEARIGSGLEAVAKKLPIKHDKGFTKEVTDLATEITSDPGLSDEMRATLTRHIDAVLGGFVTKAKGGKVVGEMSGDTYQTLTRYNTPLGRAIRAPDENLSHYAGRLRTLLDDAMERGVKNAVKNAYSHGTPQGPARAKAIELANAHKELLELRRQWHNMLVIAKTVTGSGELAAKGIITPEHLRSAMTDDKMAYAAGKGSLRRLAQAANSVLTPAHKFDWVDRAKLHAGVGGAAGLLLGLPGAAVGALAGVGTPGLAGRVINSQRGQRYLKRQPGGPPPNVHLRDTAIRGGAVGASRRHKEKKPEPHLYGE